MMTALIVFGSIALYLAVGIAIGKRRLPLMWKKSREIWRYDDFAKDSVMMKMLLCVALWPFYLPTIAIAHVLGDAVEKGDPKRKARQLAEAQRRIAELEWELGIGDYR